MYIPIIYGSVRQNRKGIRAALFLERKLSDREDITTEIIDPLDHDLPLLDKMFKEYGEGNAPENMSRLSEKLDKADAFLILTGEYNHSIPPALTNLMDHFQKEYYFKPAGIASYSAGSFGGVRAAVHIRAFLGELGMPTISSILPIPKVGSNFDEDGNLLKNHIERSSSRFLDELIWYSNVLMEGRNKYGTPY